MIQTSTSAPKKKFMIIVLSSVFAFLFVLITPAFIWYCCRQQPTDSQNNETQDDENQSDINELKEFSSSMGTTQAGTE